MCKYSNDRFNVKLHRYMIKSNKDRFNYDFNLNKFLKRNKYNSISFRNKQKVKMFQLKKRNYKIMGKYQIKYINKRN